MLVATTIAVTPAAEAEDAPEIRSAQNCAFGGTWVVTGNWDGVGGDSPGVRRAASDGQIWWHERNTTTSGPADIVFNYGTTQDCNVVGNWDGIGGDGPGVVRVNTQTGRLQWHLRNANNAGQAEAIFDYS